VGSASASASNKLSCLLEMLHSKQLRSIKMLIDSNHDIYRGENPGPGKDVHGELDHRPGIREQPGSFDVIILFHVLEHFDDRAGLSETHRVLAPARSGAADDSGHRRLGLHVRKFNGRYAARSTSSFWPRGSGPVLRR
jgi:hypothetical protein